MNDLVLAATIHRVKLCEDRIEQFEQIVSTLTSEINKFDFPLTKEYAWIFGNIAVLIKANQL